MIKLENATKRFGNKTLFENLTFEIVQGERITLLAPSGSGKSTLLRIIAGLERLDAGEVWIENELATQGAKIILPPHKRGISMVFQDAALWPHMSVEENIAFGLKMQKIPLEERKKRVNDMLKEVGLEGFGLKNVATLSGGERQRVALARALVVHPKRVLMDEPLANLDIDLKEELMKLILRLQREFAFTLVYVTHSLEEAKRIGEREFYIKSPHTVVGNRL